MRILCLLLLLAGGLRAADFIAFKSTTLTATPETLTVQQPATGSKSVAFLSAYAYCSVACTVTVSRSGIAATTTAFTPASLSQPTDTPATTAFHTSNVGAGTTLATYSLAAGESLPLDLTSMGMIGDNTARNLSIGTDSITGTAKIGIKWREQ